MRYLWTLAALAAAHLILVGLGSAHLSLRGLPLIGPGIDLYAQASGTEATYGFFAPAIDGQLQASFMVIDRQGRSREASLEAGSSHESALRMEDIIEQFGNLGGPVEAGSEDPVWRQLAASLSGSVFGRNPDAHIVVIKVEDFIPVSMADYRAGVRPTLVSVYEARFQRPEDGFKESRR